MLIRDLLEQKKSTAVRGIRPDQLLRDVANELIAHTIGALVVTDQSNKIRGVVSERDLVRAMTKFDGGLVDIPVADVMTRDVITCTEDETASEVWDRMNTHKIRHIPVVHGDTLAGMISVREIDRAYKHLQAQALTDELTGLANRRHFSLLLERELEAYQRHGQPLAVAMLDIDHFKKVNDTYGHAAGDLVLCSLAQLFGRAFRLVDYAGRLGGEEFALIFPNTTVVEAQLACERFLDEVRGMLTSFDGSEIRVTVSIGLAAATTSNVSPEGILKDADLLLYQAKSQGRDRIVTEEGDCELLVGVPKAVVKSGKAAL